MDIGLGKAIGEIIIILIIFSYFVFLIISPWFLMWGLKTVNAPQREKGKTIVTAIFNWIVLLIPIAGFVIQWFIIKSRHKLTLGKSILAWLLGVIVPIICIFLVFMSVLNAALLPIQ